MKKYLKLIVCLLFIIPFVRVNALDCAKGLIKISDENFSCSNVSGDKLTFKDATTEDDYSSFFSFGKVTNGSVTIKISKDTKFSEESKTRFVVISDDSSNVYIEVENPAYVETTTTTTTKDPNIKEITVTLDPNDGSEKITKTCDIAVGSSNCAISLPKLETTGFNGWGTAKACKEGNTGSIRVEENKTFYACYTSNTNTETSIYLKTLEITDKDTQEKIDFGTFSIKKTNYDFKVLYEVENLNIKTTQEDSVSVEITGNEELIVGKNEVVIKLTDSESNATNEYKLTVTRLKEGEKITNVHYLKNLVIGGYNITFDKEKLIYNLSIDSDIDKLLITAEALEDDAKVDIIGNENLVDGSIIQIKVTGSDKKTTIYSINIAKENNINIILIIAIGVIVLLIIILIILIVLKSKKKNNNNTNIGPNTLNNTISNNEEKKEIEVLDI